MHQRIDHRAGLAGGQRGDGVIENIVAAQLNLKAAPGQRLSRARAGHDRCAPPGELVHRADVALRRHHHRDPVGEVALAEIGVSLVLAAVMHRGDEHIDLAAEQVLERGLVRHLHELKRQPPTLCQRARNVGIVADNIALPVKRAHRRLVQLDAHAQRAALQDARNAGDLQAGGGFGRGVRHLRRHQARGRRLQRGD
jgi:hypothetical protein